MDKKKAWLNKLEWCKLLPNCNQKAQALNAKYNKNDYANQNNITGYYMTLNIKLGMLVHLCNPSIREIEAGGSWVQGQPGLYSETLSF
jgi:hypothetical protein